MSLQLVENLFAEGDWQSCHVECARVLATATNNARAILLKSVCELRRGIDATGALLELAETPRQSAKIAVLARYEAGAYLFADGNDAEALPPLRNCFLSTNSRPMLARTSYMLNAILAAAPELAEGHKELRTQLMTCRALWNADTQKDCARRLGGKATPWLGKPADWLIAFYQAQISPAIGKRCSLEPSCSTYGRQALSRHGILGLGFIADRTFREPAVVAQKQTPVRRGDRTRYRDPLNDHDGWMRNDE